MHFKTLKGFNLNNRGRSSRTSERIKHTPEGVEPFIFIQPLRGCYLSFFIPWVSPTVIHN